MIKKYRLDELYILYKKINGVNEAFICCKFDSYFIEIFSDVIIDVSINDYIESLNCDFYSFYIDSVMLLKEYNSINHFNFLKNFDINKDYKHIDVLSDALKYNKWSYQFLKKYNLNKLFVINDNNFIHICRYSFILKKYIDIFCGKRLYGSVIPFCDYLNKYDIKCDYKRLNVYSLLRIYHEINRIKDFICDGVDIKDIVLYELNMYNLYEDSKLYKQNNSGKRTTYKILNRKITKR